MVTYVVLAKFTDPGESGAPRRAITASQLTVGRSG